MGINDVALSDSFTIGKLVGFQIKQARKHAGLTQAQLAEKIGVATITIRQYEAGKRFPNNQILHKLKEALNISDGFLLGFSDDSDHPSARFEENFLMIRELIESANEQNAAAIIYQLKKFLARCTQLENIIKNDNHELLLGVYESLNDEGKEKFIERTLELAEIPRYQKESPSTPAQTHRDGIKLAARGGEVVEPMHSIDNETLEEALKETKMTEGL